MMVRIRPVHLIIIAVIMFAAVLAVLPAQAAVNCNSTLVGGSYTSGNIPTMSLSTLLGCRPEAGDTLSAIQSNGPFQYPTHDDTVFTNVENLMPPLPTNSYREYTVITPGASTRGTRRLLTSGDPNRLASQYVNLYYTDDHYSTVWLITNSTATNTPIPSTATPVSPTATPVTATFTPPTATLRPTSTLATTVAPTATTSTGGTGGIVISQVYGGGSSSGATYTNDYVELFNAGSVTVSLSGWSVQYASASGSSWQVTALSGSIAPGHYFLVAESNGSGNGTIPTPNVTGTIAMSASSGKVALVKSTSALSCSTGCVPSSTIADFVGYGSSASAYEGSGPTATLNSTSAAIRAGNGCIDTNNNSADFSVMSPNPRNASTAPIGC
jgi:guanyl-specific ribonuclease Sa